MIRTVAFAAAIAIGVAGMARADGASIMQRVVKGPENPMITTPTWEVLRPDVTEATEFLDGEAFFYFQAPETAYDAAFVPFSIRQRRGTGERVTDVTIVVDENPAPVAAAFELGPLMGDLYLESRVRYDSPSNIRAIDRTDKGNVYMIGRFVQAAGGCAAAASKDPSEALANVGKMKLRQFDARGGATRASGTVKQAQLMIRHPNFTGMQVHTGTLDRIDPRFVELVEVRLGDELLFRMTGGFSLSEDPSFRFTYRDNGALAMTVTARDTSGAVFRKSFPLGTGS